ncbi:ComF family protein [Gemmatimonas groenlandica]|uniref:ComF family protein n=1 Tax=Gemmatimonas groenlandica TaxID=2732249 RepID=A0A6M4IRY7_9BACT|nr:phosphoribosyltransferase family protein [Gemmatimonas groenlandica]QJR35031.1 ComF family protein [Gemmatimonas groenlandica]
MTGRDEPRRRPERRFAAVARVARETAQGMVDLLLPSACAICRSLHRADADGIVCQACLARVVRLSWPQCGRCGQPRLSPSMPLPVEASPSGVIPPCRWCSRLAPTIRAVRSVCRMDEGTGAALVHALKYDGWHAVAKPMARRMARLEWPPDVVRERSALVPVPLSITRQRERGYNQAERLASALSDEWRIPVWTDVLERNRNTRSQVRLTPLERASNVSGAFVAVGRAHTRLRGAHIVLVDDVITTAATINACAQALADGGARIISCVTFGRAPEPGDRAVSDYDFLRN